MDYFQLSDRKSRSISAENFTGEKGKGGMAREGFGQEYARDLGIGWKVSPAIWVEPGETVSLAHIQGQGSIRHIWIVDSCKYNRQLVLRIYWDGREYPSVEAPLCDFFACADYQTYAQLTSAQVCVNPKRAFNCYWEMPFYSQCRITLENLHTESVAVFYQIDYQLREMPAGYAYFHAQFRRSNPLPYKEDHVILEHVQGKGQYVGTYLFWGVNNNGWWGEGEVKFFLDGDGEFPTICTTGTEDYFGGSYNFDTGGQYQEFCTPYAGLAKVVRGDGLYGSQQRFSLYRWHILDAIYFDRDIRVTVQALGWRKDKRYLPLQDDISSTAYFYLESPMDIRGTLPDRDGLEII